MAPSRRTKVTVVSEDADILRTFSEGRLFFASLAYANEVITLSALSGQDKDSMGKDAVSVVIPGATLYIPLAELVDIAQEIERLEKEKKRLMSELARSRGMLSNERFLSKAPQEKVDQEKEKLAKYEQMMEQVTLRLAQLSGGEAGKSFWKKNQINTFEQAEAYLYDTPRFTRKKYPGGYKSLFKKAWKPGPGNENHPCGRHKRKRLRLCLFALHFRGGRIHCGCVYVAPLGGYQRAVFHRGPYDREGNLSLGFSFGVQCA